MASVAHVVRLLWRGARAVSAVRRTAEFSQRIVEVASDIASDPATRGISTDDDEALAVELERMGVEFRGQQRRPTRQEFAFGPEETREEHLASSREFQR